MWLLHLPLLWALLSMTRGDPQNVRGISGQLGSEVLLPVTIQLALISTDGRNCDDVTWKYGESGDQEIAELKGCLSDYNRNLTDMKISENGSLILSRVTAKHAGRYSVTIYNSTKSQIHRDDYRLHVEGEISAQPGSEVLLPVTIQLTLTPTDIQSCDEVIWKYGESGGHLIAERKRCQQPEYNRNFTNMKISENGSLIISPVTAKHAGRYRVTIHNSAGSHILTDNYRLHVEDPVSAPVLNISCLPDGQAQISCWVDKGTDYTITLHVNKSKKERSSSNITFTVPAPGPWSVSCTAKNRVSREETNQTKEDCPVSLSGIAMNHTCHRDGRAEAFCRVDKGSDPQFSWSLDGKSQKGESNSSYSRVTLPPPVSGNLRCDVTNEISRLNHSVDVFCTAPLSVPVIGVSCLSNGSTEISCNVEKGTDPSITLTINGTAEVYHKIGSRYIRITVPSFTSPSNVTCSVTNNISDSSAIKVLDTCTVPLSAPNVTFSCENNGSAIITCVVEKDQHVTYNWTVNNEQEEHYSENLSLRNHRFSSGPLNVTCSVNTTLDRKVSNITQVFCPAPVSVPLVNVSCSQNGSAVISCWVQHGTDPWFSLTLNGKSVLNNSSSSWMGVNYTEHSEGSWNVSCSVSNKIGVTETSQAILICTELCYSCLQKSIMGGSAFLLLMSPFYILAYWYTLRNMRKDAENLVEKGGSPIIRTQHKTKR